MDYSRLFGDPDRFAVLHLLALHTKASIEFVEQSLQISPSRAYNAAAFLRRSGVLIESGFPNPVFVINSKFFAVSELATIIGLPDLPQIREPLTSAPPPQIGIENELFGSAERTAVLVYLSLAPAAVPTAAIARACSKSPKAILVALRSLYRDGFVSKIRTGNRVHFRLSEEASNDPAMTAILKRYATFIPFASERLSSETLALDIDRSDPDYIHLVKHFPIGSDRQAEILSAITVFGPLTIKQLARLCGRGHSTTKSIVHTLFCRQLVAIAVHRAPSRPEMWVSLPTARGFADAIYRYARAIGCTKITALNKGLPTDWITSSARRNHTTASRPHRDLKEEILRHILANAPCDLNAIIYSTALPKRYVERHISALRHANVIYYDEVRNLFLVVHPTELSLLLQSMTK